VLYHHSAAFSGNTTVCCREPAARNTLFGCDGAASRQRGQAVVSARRRGRGRRQPWTQRWHAMVERRTQDRRTNSRAASARAPSEPMQGVRGREHLPASAHQEQVQGVRARGHLPAGTGSVGDGVGEGTSAGGADARSAGRRRIGRCRTLLQGWRSSGKEIARSGWSRRTACTLADGAHMPITHGGRHLSIDTMPHGAS
jgi:hypothetical protein